MGPFAHKAKFAECHYTSRASDFPDKRKRSSVHLIIAIFNKIVKCICFTSLKRFDIASQRIPYFVKHSAICAKKIGFPANPASPPHSPR
jgi:hypothetical protein